MLTSTTQAGTPLGAREPFHRVLVATALDEAGALAARRAARLPLAPGARVTVLHVEAAGGRAPPRIDAALEALSRTPDAGAGEAGDGAPRVAARVARGSVATEIVRAAWEDRAELVVVGAPSARGDGRASPTVARVLRGAELPLLVARRPAERPWARVICAVGRSVAAPETIALAVRLARPAVERLTVLHAYHVPFEPMLRPDPEVLQRAQAHAAALARLASAEVGCVRTEVRRGEPGVELLRLAVRERADLVVLGTQGRSALSRLLLGSAAEWIVANAPCDVAVARPHRVALESLP